MTPELKGLILILILLFIIALIYILCAARDLRDANEKIYEDKLKKRKADKWIKKTFKEAK